MKGIIKKSRTRLFKKFKTYSAAEIIAAGGATAFGKLTGHNPDKVFEIEGEPISDEQLEAALKDLERSELVNRLKYSYFYSTCKSGF